MESKLKTNLLTVLFAFTLLFSLPGCDNGNGNSTDNNIVDIDQITADGAVDEVQDETADDPIDIDLVPDEDAGPVITIKCPETIDEDNGKTLCVISSINESMVLDSGDTCGGYIDTSGQEDTYSFTPSESFGPGSCIAKIKDTVSGETAQAEITINEVNAPPKFTSSDFEGFEFGETYLSKRTFYFSDDDDPRELETDPGFASCSVRDNTCGVEIDVLNELYSCTLSGTMPEELSSGDCSFKLVLTDGYGEETIETVSSALIEKNETPVWSDMPWSMEVNANTTASEINGNAVDTDLPNKNEGDPGYLSCVYDSDTCTFDVEVSSVRDTDGSVSCKVDLTSNDIETCTVQYSVTDGIKSIYSGNVQIKVNATLSIECPDTINEMEELFCDVYPNGGTPTVGAVAQSCNGSVVNENGQWKYKKTFTEFESPMTCVAAVAIGSVKAEDSVDVLEVNTTPELSFNGDCSTPDSATGTENADFYCYANISDADSPNLIATDPGFTTCEIKDNTCTSWLTFDENCNGTGKPDEESGDTQCSYTVEVSDGYGAKTSQTVTISIAELNATPEFTTTPATQYHLLSGEHFEFTYSASDSDLPTSSDSDPGYLKCSVISDEAQSVISSTGEGSATVTCNVEIDAHSDEECAFGCPVQFLVEDGYGRTRTQHSYIFVRKCVFFVKPDGTGSEGRDWSDAFGTVQEAVDKAWSGCEIWVQQGTYTTIIQDGSPVVTMKPGVRIIGGFEGDELYDHSIADKQYRPGLPIVHSVLDGEDASYHVVVGNMENASIDGFIITGGNASGAEDHQKVGGGLYNYASENIFSHPYVKHCIFAGNYAENDGGAVYNEGFSSPRTEFYKCFFYENNSGRFGGAIFSKDASNIEYKECEFLKNTSNNGGAIAEYHSASIVEKCVFKENKAQVVASVGGAGGAILLTWESAVIIENSIFIENEAETFGGAIDGGENDLLIADHITFVNNTSSVAGSEAIYGMEGQVKNSIFWNNGIDSTDIVITYSYGTGDTGTGNINSMPVGSGMFINEESDLHLDSTSPAIDSGHPSPHLHDDIEGTARPFGDLSDMGAYEYKSVSAKYFIDCEAASSGDGMSWATPFKSFHDATDYIESSGRMGNIFVKGGTCSYSEIGDSRDSIVSLNDDIKIYGGFAGTEKYLRERTDPSLTPTLLDGQMNDITIIKIADNSDENVIDGFVIKNGHAGGFYGALQTGSIVANCIFEGNKAQYGGAMHIIGSPYHTVDPALIVNTAFINNQADSDGGAIYFNHQDSTNIDIFNCNFLYNSIKNLATVGSAISEHGDSAHFDIKNSIFWQNITKRSTGVDQVKHSDGTNLTFSVTDSNPLLVNAPEFFAISNDPGTTTRIDLYSTVSGLTEDHLIEVNNDGILRDITSISGASVNFSPALSSPTAEGDSAQFWPQGTTSADLDMHLTGSSSCVDNGTFAGESIRDYSGNERDKDAFDIGIYEY